MKHALLLALCLLAPACASAPAGTPHEIARPDPPRPQDPQAFLERFVGDWTITASMDGGPDGEPMTMESTESVRRVGGWIVSEQRADLDGTPFQSLMTVGYDPERAAFVGTWIDSMTNHLWIYDGRLDAAGTTLTLEGEGPAFEDPTVTRTYRDAVEIVSDDHRVLRSSVLMDGAWVEYMRADVRRKR